MVRLSPRAQGSVCRQQTNKSCPTELRAQGRGQAGGGSADDLSEVLWKETRVPCTGGTEQQQISKPEAAGAAERTSEGHPEPRQHSGRNTAEAAVVRATVAWPRGASPV